MATVTIQQGHVARTRGATGTHREQEAARAIGARVTARLRRHGHVVHLIGADDRVPASDAFIALHCDGSTNRDRRGASVGYPDRAGNTLAAAWKRAHQRAGYPGGFLADNYTAALRGYYGFGRSSARFRFLAEHATTTNPRDEAWLFANLDAVAAAHVAAIGEVLGHPDSGDIVSDPIIDLTPTNSAVDVTVLPDGRTWTFAADGGVFTEGGADYHGSMGGVKMNATVVAGVVDPDGKGYALVGADGGIFIFGAFPAVQPYTPLINEFARGERRIVAARAHSGGLLLLSNLGERYALGE